jgi:hypothetical protein
MESDENSFEAIFGPLDFASDDGFERAMEILEIGRSFGLGLCDFAAAEPLKPPTRKEKLLYLFNQEIIRVEEESYYMRNVTCRSLEFDKLFITIEGPGTFIEIKHGPTYCTCDPAKYICRMFYFVNYDNSVRLAIIANPI